MAKRKINTLFIYRRRVLLAYAFIISSLLVLLVLALSIPGGLTQAEQDSSVRALNFGIIGVNAPYYWLQKASISILGLSTFSIKLPSLILGALLGVTLFLLLRRWLTLGIAVFSALIIFAGTTFLSLTGTGSPVILYVLFPTLLMFFGTRVLAHDRGLIVFAGLLLVTIALALLTPTMIYLLILVFIMALFNPHVRYGFSRLPFGGLSLLILGFIVAVIPLAYLVVTHPATLQQILAIPSSLTIGSVGENISTLFALYGQFLHPGLTQGMIAPLVGLATAGLALIGIYRIVRAIYTARAQFIVGWSAIALILALIDPGLGILLYLPVVLLASIGLSQLAAIWYRTFPLNPYARISALVPIGVLIAGIVVGSSLRYINTTLYETGSAELYSHDLPLLQRYLATAKPTGVTLAVPPQDVAFYQNINTPAITRVVPIGNATIGNGSIIATEKLTQASTPSRILTDSRIHDADRFYIYK